MALPSGCTMCVGSGVMCRVKRGTLRSGEYEYKHFITYRMKKGKHPINHVY